jgi:hypothetical protein
MANSSVPITAGSGTNIDTYAVAGGDHQQIVREARAATGVASTWTLPATGTASILTASEARVAMLIVNNCNQRVYIDFDAIIPSITAFAWYLETGDRWEVPKELVQLAISMLPGGTVSSGSVLILEGRAL